MLYLGVDLGGTNIKAALVNSEGEILCEANTPTNLPRPAEAVCDDIAALCLQLAEGKDVAGVGVGCPGTVDGGTVLYSNNLDCNGVQREHNKKLNNGLPILHKVPPKRDYGRYFCIMAEKGGTSHGGLTEKLSPFFHAKKQEVNAYGR